MRSYTFTIGESTYSLDEDSLPPYLAGLVAFRAKSQQRHGATDDCQPILHDGDIPLFDIALSGMQQGYRFVFRRLGQADLSQYRTLCETYDFLGEDVVDEQSLDMIINEVKAGRNHDSVMFWRTGQANKTTARDAAFKLLYIMLMAEFENADKDERKIYNAVQFVVSHAGTFKLATRGIIRAAYEERFPLSQRQRDALDQWSRRFCSDVDTDATTSEDEADLYEWNSD